MVKRAADVWVEVRRAYEQGALPGVLARQWPVSRREIDTRAAREGWQRTRVRSADGGARSVHEHDPGDERKVEDPKVARDLLIKGHQQAWYAVDDIHREMVRACSDLSYLPLGVTEPWTTYERHQYALKLARMFKIAAEGLKVAQEGERRAWGFDHKMQRTEQELSAEEQARHSELLDEVMELIKSIPPSDQRSS